MCVSSMISQHYGDRWIHQYPDLLKPIDLGYKGSPQFPQPLTPEQVEKFLNPEKPISRKEFELLRQEVQQMKELMEKAISYDKEHNEPHCEQEEKIALIKRMAELVGVDMNSVLKGLQE